MVLRVGFEPTTFWLQIRCTTNYANAASLKTSIVSGLFLPLNHNSKSFWQVRGTRTPIFTRNEQDFTASCWYDPSFSYTIIEDWANYLQIIIPSNVLPSSKLPPIVFKHNVFKQGALILWSLPPDPFKGGVPQSLYRKFAVCAHQNFLKNNQWRKLYPYEFTLSTRKNFIILLCCFFATGFFFSASATSWK